MLCEPCSSNIAGSVALSIFTLIGCLIVLYLFLLYSRRSSKGAARPIINMCQMVQVLLMFDVGWPESFRQLQALLSGMVFLAKAGIVCRRANE